MNEQLPFWIDSEDVSVKITKDGLRCSVRNEFDVVRTFWQDTEKAKKDKDYLGTF